MRQIVHPFLQSLISPQEVKPLSGESVLIPRCEYRLKPWRGTPVANTYGGKAVLSVGGKPAFAEIAILRILRDAGWDGVWVDTYRKRFRQDFAPHHCGALPSHAQDLYDRICQANDGKISGWFDVFAWKRRRFLFVESKRRGKDFIRRSQIEWIEATLASGVPLESLLIFEWHL